jgi:NADH-quinone oxidoreductase subunit A
MPFPLSTHLYRFAIMEYDYIMEEFYTTEFGGYEMEQLNIYHNSYLIVTAFLLLGILLPVVALTIGRVLRPSKPTAEKQTTYESGIEPFHESWVQFNVRYYVFALLFVIFDVETIFLYPWAVAYDRLGLFALIEVSIFVVLLLIGLAYAWKKKVLKWT